MFGKAKLQSNGTEWEGLEVGLREVLADYVEYALADSAGKGSSSIALSSVITDFLVKKAGFEKAALIAVKIGEITIEACSGFSADVLKDYAGLAEALSHKDASLTLQPLLHCHAIQSLKVRQNKERQLYLILGRNQAFESFPFQHIAAIIDQSYHQQELLSNLGTQLEQLKHLDEVRNAFVSASSHQLRTPLSVIKWIFSVLTADPELQKMESKLQMINQAYQSLERVIDTVNDLLNVSRIQNGKLPYTPRPTDPNDLLKEIVPNTQQLADSRSIIMKVEKDEQFPQVNLDPILVKEALENIINNALDYSAEKGTVEIGVHVKDGNLEFTVTNQGIGIKEEDKVKMFTPHYRSAEALMAHPDGSGVGLYLSKAIVAAHEGSLEYVSVPGETTTFTMRLPIKPIEAPAAP